MINSRLRCELISWRHIYKLSQKLANIITSSGFQPDKVVAIGRGGYIPARILCDFLDIYNLSAIRVEHYKKGMHRKTVARVVDPLCADVSGQRLLVVDDVSDTGDTFQVAVEHIRGFNPLEIKTAVLHHKIVADFVPDYFAHKIIKWRWLIYHWAMMEDLTDFVRQMENRPASAKLIARRLKKDYGINVSGQMLALVMSCLK